MAQDFQKYTAWQYIRRRGLCRIYRRWEPSYNGPANDNGKKSEADCPVPIPSHYVPNGTLFENFRTGHQWLSAETQAEVAHSLQTPRTARTVQTHKIVSLQTCIGPPTCRYWKVEWEAVPNEQPPSGENVEALLEDESWVHEIAITGTIKHNDSARTPTGYKTMLTLY